MQELTPYNFAEFERALEEFKLSQTTTLGVAVSGGADSLALTFLLDEWARKHGKKFVALHVDHRLRSESQEEAEQLQAWLKAKGIPLRILVWNHNGIDSRIQENARNARYQLLEEECKDEGISHLFLAHHQSDQDETFWMRLLKGSGPEGLAGMKLSHVRGALTLVRPLLSVIPQRLKLYLNEMKHPWIQDPSNENEGYLRIRIRSALREDGHSFEMLSKTMKRLREDADFFEAVVSNWIAENVREDFSFLREKIISCPPALGKRVLIHLLQKVGGSSYPPRADSLDHLWNALHNPSFKGSTLGYCCVKKLKDFIVITRETRSS